MVSFQGDLKISGQSRMKCTISLSCRVDNARREENSPNMLRRCWFSLDLATYVNEHSQWWSLANPGIDDGHLSAVLHISTLDIQPDFDSLVKAQQRLDFSHWTRKKSWKTPNEVVGLQMWACKGMIPTSCELGRFLWRPFSQNHSDNHYIIWRILLNSWSTKTILWCP